MAALLVVASLLLSVFGKSGTASAPLAGVQHCFVDYWDRSRLVDFLRAHVPPELADQIVFRPISQAALQNGSLVYPTGVGAIQIRPEYLANQGPRYLVQVWYPGDDSSVMAPYEIWFWEQAQAFTQERLQAGLAQVAPEAREALRVPIMRGEREGLRNSSDARAGIVTALVFFALFFICVYLLPSMTCEERERGVLLAQALSPASPREILGAKFLFYPTVAMALAALIAGLYHPRTLAMPFFWLALAAWAAGALGIGLTISSIARTQRAASLGAMCYMFAIALLQFICNQTDLPALNFIALEYHGPRMIHAALTNSVVWFHWWNLVAAIILSSIWALVATRLFRTRGWQ